MRNKKKVNYWIFLLTVIFFWSCTSLRIIQPTKKYYMNYSINEVRKVNIGEAIISIEKAQVRDAYVAIMDYQTPTTGVQQTREMYINKYDRFVQVAENSSDPNDIFIKRDEPTRVYKVINIYTNGKVNNGWVLADGIVPVQGIWTNEQLFTKSDIPSRMTENSFKSEIIYSGLTGNTVRAVYREYSEDLARPAFSQELQYNLDESKFISYKSIKIEIIKATNSIIEYKVIDDGGLTWFPK